MDIEKKKCNKCLNIKPIIDFYKGRSECIVCGKKYREENKEKIKLQKQEYYKLNKEHIKNRINIYVENNESLVKQRKVNYRKNNKTKICEWQKQHRLDNIDKLKQKGRKYFSENKEKIGIRVKKYRKTEKAKTWWREYRKKLKQNPQHRIARALRDRIRDALQNNRKYGKSMDLLGCSIQFYKSYLESKFQYGMSWENYGQHGWHIDHIIPCISFDLTIEENQRKCFNYANTQPLWAEDNFSKGSKQYEIGELN